MKPMEARARSMELMKYGMLGMMPGLIGSVAGISFLPLNILFFVGLGLLFVSLLIRTRYFRCPHCGIQLHAQSAVTLQCHKCGGGID